MAPKQIAVFQTDSNIIINRVQTDGEGKEYTTAEKLLYDGNQVNIPMQSGDRIKKVVLLPNDSGLTAFAEVTYPGSNNEIGRTILHWIPTVRFSRRWFYQEVTAALAKWMLVVMYFE